MMKKDRKKVRRGRFAAYILRCSDGTLYSGYANDLDKRLKCHNSGKGAKYTRGRLPVKLAWHKDFKYYKSAVKMEAALKRLTKEQKGMLIVAYEKVKKKYAPPALPRPKVFIKTFGCQMNEADSDLIASAFEKRNFIITRDLNEADAAVLNTCTVRQLAEDKAMSMVGRLRKWKALNPLRKVIVAGCAAEKLGSKNIVGKFPFVDMVIGAKSIDRFDKVLSDIMGESGKFKRGGEASLFNSPITAYVTVMRGCSLKCSYCIVPAVRGEAYNISPREILKEVRLKSGAGIKEFVLLGQTVNAYSFKDGKKTVDFTTLIEMISKIKGVERIRFMSPHPLFFNDDFFRVFAKNKKIARHIHLPAQSGSNKILKLMRRGYTKKQYLDIIGALRLADKDISVSTDFIVGYPGETERDFNETLKLAKEGGFSFAFCFKYSPRTDEALGDKNLLPEEVVKKRLDILLNAIKANSKRIFASRIGKIADVLIEDENCGRSSANFKVKLDRLFKPGEMVKARITKAEKNILYAKVVK